MTENLALKEIVCDSEENMNPEVLIAKQELAVRGQISVSFLSRKLKCSYSRAYEIFNEVMKDTKKT